MATTKSTVTNFGTVQGLRITNSGRTPMATFKLVTGEKFSRDVVVYGQDRVNVMKSIGDGRKAWVRGEIVEMRQRNEKGGTYMVPTLKGYNLKDITDPAPKAGTDVQANTTAKSRRSTTAKPKADAPAAQQAPADEAAAAAQAQAEAKAKAREEALAEVPF